jgi:acyl-CoA synthetase (NDP forming)
MHPLDSLLKPQSIAVVGASRKAGSIGREILHQLIEFEYRGMLFCRGKVIMSGFSKVEMSC